MLAYVYRESLGHHRGYSPVLVPRRSRNPPVSNGRVGAPASGREKAPEAVTARMCRAGF